MHSARHRRGNHWASRTIAPNPRPLTPRRPFMGAMRVLPLLWLLCVTPVFAATFLPTAQETPSSATKTKMEPSALARMLAELPADLPFLAIDDMRFRRPRRKTKAGFDVPGKWTDGIVYYAFDTNVPAAERAAWLRGASLWSCVSTITLMERTTEPNYILVKNATSDYAEVGMVGGEQQMGINSWFAPYVVAHEMGHALGLWHEHSRPDREAYVEVIEANIDPAQLHNFQIEPMITHGDYDFDSLMHYKRNAFSINSQNTLVPRPTYSTWLYLIGQNSHLSLLDAQGMAWRYGGTGTLASPTVNGTLGFQNLLVDLSWTAIPGATSYVIEYGDNADGPPYTTAQPGSPAPGTNVGNVTSRTIEGLTRGTRYYFAVRAANGPLLSPYTRPAIVRIPPPRTDDVYEPNNESATAYDITPTQGRWLSTLLGTPNFWDSDYYRITVPPGRENVEVACRFAWIDGRLGVRLWNPSDWIPLAESYVEQQDEQWLNLTVAAPGEYLIQVFGQTLGNTYDLWWDALPVHSAVEPGPAGWTCYR